MKIPKPIALMGFAYAAMAMASLDLTEGKSSLGQVKGQDDQLSVRKTEPKMGPEDIQNKYLPILDGDKVSTFFVGDFQDPTVVFRDGLQPGFDTGLEDTVIASTPKHVLVSPSHEASIDMSFAQQESEAQIGFVYQVTLHGLPRGYWLHSANRNDDEEIADIFVVPGAIPSRNIQGVYIYQKDSSGLPVKTKWIPNQNPSDTPRPRKRQTNPCVPIDPDDPDAAVDNEPGTTEGGEDEEDMDPRCYTNYHGSPRDRERDRKRKKKAGTSWRRRNCL